MKGHECPTTEGEGKSPSLDETPDMDVASTAMQEIELPTARHNSPLENASPGSSLCFVPGESRRLTSKEFFSSSDLGTTIDDDVNGDYLDSIIPEEKPAHPDELLQRIYTILIAGTGFLADSYDLFVINIVLLMMRQNESYGPLTPDVQTHVSFMAIVGAMAGQLGFGFLGDQYGRRRMFLLTAALTIVGNVLQATAQPRQSMGIYQQMMLYRFIMGMGVGGEYPAAGTITSENSTAWQRGRNLAAVFSMQGVGRLLCALVLLISAFTIENTDLQWRVAIIVGALPMMAAIFFRWLPETDAFRHHVEARYPNMRLRFKNIWRTVWENRRALAGTAGSWFILDMLFYGNSLFSADVTETMGFGSGIRGRTVQNLIIQSMAMPGYILAVIFIDRIGKKRLQLIGFFGEGLIFGFMAAYQSPLKQAPVVFLLMYALTFLFDNFGANTATFVIPAVIYPTEARSTCHGISAAAGKAGAVVGASAFLRLVSMYCPNHICSENVDPVLIDKGIRTVFYWCAVLSLVGFLWTCIFVHDRSHKSLDCKAPLTAPVGSPEYEMA